MDLKQRNRIVRAINKYVRAFDADSWKGGGDPDDIPNIERRLARTKIALKRALDAAMTEPEVQQYDH